MAVINMRISNFQIADIPGCDVKTLRQEFGWFRLSADSVRLENRTAKLSEQDRCHRQNNFEGRPAGQPSLPDVGYGLAQREVSSCESPATIQSG